ncbi:MAG: hypothetical protein U5K69_21100 [Balneolaceae bacterium]|nr:hypothetical protein [Balneolaceae bacterium]
MILLQSDELHNHAKGVIHKETQNHAFSLDLTVNKIKRFMEGARLILAEVNSRLLSLKHWIPKKEILTMIMAGGN